MTRKEVLKSETIVRDIENKYERVPYGIWELRIDHGTDSYYINRSVLANDCNVPTDSVDGLRTLDFLVAVYNDFPKILEYIRHLENQVDRIEEMEDQIYDLREEIADLQE